MTNIEKYPISIDTALEVIGIIQCTKRGAEFQNLEQEKQIILGLCGDEKERTEMFNKVHKVYCPELKNGIY
jgi:hypothetical protein